MKQFQSLRNLKCYKIFFKLSLLIILSLGSLPTIAQHSVARQWNEVLLEAIRNDFARPTVHARNLLHTSIVLYDAWAAYDSIADPYFLGDTVGTYYCPFSGITTPSNIDSARNEALSYAGYRLLKHRFSNSPGANESLPLFDSLMMALGYDTLYVDTNYTNGNPAALGNYLAQSMISFGLQDGSNEQNDYVNTYYSAVNPFIAPVVAGNPSIIDPNRWQPILLDVFIDQSGNPFPLSTPPPFLSPEWGDVVPFAMNNSDRVQKTRDGDNYWVYKDPGGPALIDTSNMALTAEYQWGFSLVSAWGSHLDTTDGVMWDISPASIGNNPAFPTDIAGLRNFYNLEEGGDQSVGRSINPKTGQPYTPQMVKRGDYARVLAEFWADGPASETPPGHWFTIINYVNDHPQIVKKWRGQGALLSDLEWDVKCYLTLAGAVHDAAVAAWSIKGYYDFIRPVSAIRYMADQGQSTDTTLANYSPMGIPLIDDFIEVVEAGDPLAGIFNEHVGKIKVYTWKGPDYISNPLTDAAGVDWILAENWWPYQRPTFVTPPFAGYVSGHSTFSRAAAEVLTLMTGDEYFPGGVGEFVAPKNEFLVFEEGPSEAVILQWATYRDASDQCSLSRIWGGIHPPADDIPGRIIGEELGIDAFHFAEQYFKPACTIAIADSITDVSCFGATDGAIEISLSGSQMPLSVIWSNGDTTQSVSNLGAGLYTVTVSDNNACTANVTLTVEQPGKFATISTSDSTTFCAWNGALLNAPIDTGYTYQWFRYNKLLTSNSHSVMAKQNGAYRCVITNSNGCSDTSNAIITTKLPLPIAQINQSSPIEICGSQPTELSAVSGQGYTYQWLINRRFAPGIDTNSIYLAGKTGNYKVRVTHANGCSKLSQGVSVINNPAPKAEIDQSGPLSVCYGDTVSLNAIPSRGTPPFITYQWYRYSNVINGETDSTLNVTKTGGYSVRIGDSKNCFRKSPRTIVTYNSCPRIMASNTNSSFDVNVYPNPFSESIKLDIVSSHNNRLTIKIIDALGRIVYFDNISTNGDLTIDTQKLVSGLYILEVDNDMHSQRIKILKN